MNRRKSQYSAAKNDELTTKILTILRCADEALTIDQIVLLGGFSGVTSQKLARVIKELNNIEPIIKCKNAAGRMTYKLRALHAEQGYDMSYIAANGAANFKKEPTYWSSEGYVAPRYRCYYNPDGTEKGEEGF